MNKYKKNEKRKTKVSQYYSIVIPQHERAWILWKTIENILGLSCFCESEMVWALGSNDVCRIFSVQIFFMPFWGAGWQIDYTKKTKKKIAQSNKF